MKILYFDLSAILIIDIMIVDLFLRKNQKNFTNKILLFIYINVLITTIFDLWSEAYNIWFLANETDSTFRYFLYYGYFYSRNLTPLLFQIYLYAVTETLHLLKKSRKRKIILIFPYCLVCALLISNIFLNNVFYFDDNLIYTRSTMFYGLHICAFMYFVYGLSFLFKYRKVLSIDKFISLVCFYPWNLFAILVQAFIPEYLVEMFLNTVSLFLVSNIVQRLEEVINPLIGIKSHIAYSTDMKKVFYLKKPVRILILRIVNYPALLTILGNDACNDLMKQIANKMKYYFATSELYYLENGLFASSFEQTNFDRSRDNIKNFRDSICGSFQFGKMELEMDSCLCVFSCPQDFDNYDKMMSFVYSFYSYLPANGNITFLADENDKQKYKFHLRNEIDHIISKAIEENRFEMYYQPIYSVKHKKFISAEALIRLKDEKFGFIPPDLFIKAAENNGTILQIGEIVLDNVCNFISRCTEAKLPINFFEINLSMKQCVQVDLKDKILFYLKKYNLKPEQVNLEITETAANTAQDIVLDNIKALKDIGVSFALDDYGTGYSNLSRIISLPLKIVKIDKSMTDKVFDSKINSVLKYSVSLLKEIGMEIVVEGVETEDVLNCFVQMGCDYIQGYHFSKPLPEADFIEFIKKHNI